MNTFQKIRKNAKALSPVVASIILIAVTVAVSVAVAAWMGGMSLGFMQTEQVTIQNPTFDTTNQAATVDIRNTGTQPLVISKVTINGVDVTSGSLFAAAAPNTAPYTLAANTGATISMDCASGPAITAGYNYQITVTTSKGNAFSTSAIAPQ